MPVLDEIIAELRKACIKHPVFPSDVVHMVAIMAEEAGEAVQAANDCLHSGCDLERLRSELRQTAAMCIRVLQNLPGV